MWKSILMLIIGTFLFKMEFRSSLKEYMEKGDKLELAEAIAVALMLVAALILLIGDIIQIA